MNKTSRASDLNSTGDNRIILMFRSNIANSRSKEFPMIRSYETLDPVTKQYEYTHVKETPIRYQRKCDNAIIEVTEVSCVPRSTNIMAYVKDYIEKSFHTDLEYLGIALRYVHNN